MKTIPIHRHLHDVFGENQTVFELVATILFGISVPVVLIVAYPDPFGAVPVWRAVLALILILDIAAGCAANFTRSTNDFYAERPRNRWIFIAIHAHLLVVALLLGLDMYAACFINGYTLLAATLVNALKGQSLQTFLGGLLLSVGLAALVLIPTSSILSVVGTLFIIKVIFSFSVDHYPQISMVRS